MKDSLDKQLVKGFPTIFEGRYDKPENTAMCWGFECGDGWFLLIRKLCEDIMTLDTKKKVRALQVKEKYGKLRFYIGFKDGYHEYPAKIYDKIFELVHEAEQESGNICEVCGAVGTMRDLNKYYMTLCDACNLKVRKRMLRPRDPRLGA